MSLPPLQNLHILVIKKSRMFFCGMVDQQKVISLISSREHCQRFSPSQFSDTLQAGFEPDQNLRSDFFKWTCAEVITTTSQRQKNTFAKLLWNNVLVPLLCHGTCIYVCIETKNSSLKILNIAMIKMFQFISRFYDIDTFILRWNFWYNEIFILRFFLNDMIFV